MSISYCISRQCSRARRTSAIPARQVCLLQCRDALSARLSMAGTFL